jgi:hypothetical protein
MSFWIGYPTKSYKSDSALKEKEGNSVSEMMLLNSIKMQHKEISTPYSGPENL